MEEITTATSETQPFLGEDKREPFGRASAAIDPLLPFSALS